MVAHPVPGTAPIAALRWVDEALVAQGIEHAPPERGAQVRILPGARTRPAQFSRRGLAFVGDERQLIVDRLRRGLERQLKMEAVEYCPAGGRCESGCGSHGVVGWSAPGSTSTAGGCVRCEAAGCARQSSPSAFHATGSGS